jgi:putative peptidoglycan lipid II flippase
MLVVLGSPRRFGCRGPSGRGPYIRRVVALDGPWSVQTPPRRWEGARPSFGWTTAAGSIGGTSTLVDTFLGELLASRSSWHHQCDGVHHGRREERAAAMEADLSVSTVRAHSHTVVRGFASIGVGTLVSRATGFAREVITAAIFGAGTSMDIFVAAFTIPNLLCRVLGETTVESAFMPLFRGLHSRGEVRRAWRLASGTLLYLTAALAVVVVVGIVAAPLLVQIVAHGFAGEEALATVRMTQLMFPFGLLIGLAALMGAIVLSFRRYRVYSLAPVLLNVGIIASVLALSGRLSYVSLGVGVLVGGALQFLVQLPFAARLAHADGARLISSGASFRDEDMKRVAVLSGPVVIASAIQRIGVVVDRTIASFLVPGSISSLYYSFRLVHLPYAILALAAGRAVAPELAEQYALGRHAEFKETLLSGLRMDITFLTPVVILTVWLARPIVGLVYERGAFDETDLTMTASALAMYAIGLVGMGAVFLLVRAFAARLDTRTPVRVSVVAFFLNVVLNLLLVRTPLKHAGLALASSLAFSAHAVILYVILNGRAREEGTAIRPSELLAPTVKVALASIVLLLVTWAMRAATSSWLGIRFADDLTVRRLVLLAVCALSGGAAYLVAAALLGVEEVRHLVSRIVPHR